MTHSEFDSPFKELGRLGRGGTAEVLRVFVSSLGRQAALKCPLGDASDHSVDFQKLAAREQLLIGGVNFPGLVRLLESPSDHPEHLLLELCEGPTLDRIGVISDLSLALNVLSAITVDLEFIRRKKIIHGDLKPHNFFAPQDWQAGAAGRLTYFKLSDFSLGRFEHEPEFARAGLGTVGYMAPEMITDGRSSHQSDLFALGVIAFQLLTGHHPFMMQDSDPVKINARIREDVTPPMERFRPDLPPSLKELVNDLLAKEDNHRPRTALAVLHTLQEIGATFPFERALVPKYFFTSGASYNALVSELLPDCQDKRKWLDTITDRDTARLRCILDANHRRGSLPLAEKGFAPRELYWPSHLRSRELKQFAAHTFALKRRNIENAVQSGVGEPASLPALLLPLLRPATVKRFSRRLAPIAEKSDAYELATRLYLQAGQLEAADRCALQAATALRSNHQAGDAVLCINSVLDFARNAGRLRDIRSLLMLKGDILKEAGETDQAFATYQQLIDLYSSLPPDKLLAETYKDLGDLYKTRQDAKAGLESLQQALEIFRQLGDELEVSRTYNNIGNSYYYAGDVVQTITQYRRALRIQRRLRAAAETASTLTNLGAIYCLKGRFRRGTFLLQKSLDLKKDLGNAGEIARTLNNLGYALHLSGQPEKGIAALQEALEINRRIGSKKEILYNLENLTEVQLAAGFLRDSLSYLTDGLSLAREQDDKPHQAQFLRSLAETYVYMGRIGEAEATLRDLVELVASIDDPIMTSMVDVVAGEIRAEVGDTVGAVEHFRAAYETALVAQLKLQELVSLLWLIRFADEPALLERSRELAEELGMKRELQQVQLHRIEYLLETDRLSEASTLIAQSADTCQSLPEALDTPRLLRVAAETQLRAGQRTDSAQYLARALRLAQRSALTGEMAKILSVQGQIESAHGHYGACYAKCRQALQLCKHIADSIPTESDRVFFQNTRSVRFLVDEIRRLGKLLEKQRAGNPALP